MFLDLAVLSMIDVFILFFSTLNASQCFFAETLHSLRVFKIHLPERQREPSGLATFLKVKEKVAETQNYKFR